MQFPRTKSHPANCDTTMRAIVFICFGLLSYLGTASIGTTESQVTIDVGPSQIPGVPLRLALPPKYISCQNGGTRCKTGCCDTTRQLCTAFCHNMTSVVPQRRALRQYLDNETTFARLDSSCQMDADCLPGTCCSVEGKCSFRETPQCGGPPKQAISDVSSTQNVTARLGSFCDTSSACRTGCCSIVHGICMFGKNEQCLLQLPPDEL